MKNKLIKSALSSDRIGLALALLLCSASLGLAATSTVFAAAPGEDDSSSLPRFAQAFGDHMVIQREKPIRVWGRAAPGSKLTVELADQTREVRADADGAWQLELAAMPAGGPYTLSLGDASGIARSVSDVLIGDVWLCSGQSNMAWPAGEVNLPPAPLPAATANIRLKTIALDSQAVPQSSYPEAPQWSVADAASIHDFSAVCFLLAWELQKTEAIPFGLINASWGGSAIKAWISTDGLKKTGNYERQLDWLQTYASDKGKANKQFGEAWEAWWRRVNPDAGQPWLDPVDENRGWKPNPAVMGDWKKYGDPSLAEHLGMVWFARSFELSAEQAAQDAVLSLGGIDEVDYLWVNGRFIGSTFGWGTERLYPLAKEVLNAGANTITVNVLNTWAAGGMIGPNDVVRLKFPDGQSVALGDAWLYRKVAAEVPAPPRTPWESLGGLSGMSNAMIAPLEGLKLAGVIWYQGETDAGNPGPYENLLTTLGEDWRRRFGEPLPFVIVQLPGFGKLTGETTESGWAAIRDAQRRAALAHPDTGLVVTIDAGDRNNLHPPDKRVVGLRAADVAGVLAYGRAGIADGLSPKSAYRQGDDVVLEFDPAIDRLVVISAAAPIAFELCGNTPGDCVYADARIDGNRVLLPARDLPQATRVRHCWADAPICNLYGASGLPVSSFEIDITAGRSN